MSRALALLLVLAVPAAAQFDPLPLRRRLLAEMDHEIATLAARQHLEARRLLDGLLPLAWLGLDAEPDGPELYVTRVHAAGAAEAAGVRVGDTLLAVGSEALTSAQQLEAAIRCRRPGDAVELHVRRDGEPRTLTVTLGQILAEDEEDELPGDVAAPFLPQGLPLSLRFDDAEPGVPSPALLASGAPGAAPAWIVRGEPGWGVLAHAADRSAVQPFPVAVVRGVDAADVKARTRFRLVPGGPQRAAGLVLHYQDEWNYLVARGDAVDGDLRICRTVDGRRRTLPGARAPVDIEDGEWHTLEFSIDGPAVTAAIDGNTIVSSYDTTFGHGGVGLWTRAGAVTEFDDLFLEAPAAPR